MLGRMSDVIGIGFIGAGANTRLRHLPGFAALEGVKLVSVANRSEASSRKVAEAWSISRVAPDWRAVIADPEVDAVCIGTWPYLHAEASVAALEAGKHVLTEARMAADLAGAEAMHAASKAHPDCVAQIVPSPFTLEVDATVMELLREGRLGDILEVQVEHSHSGLLDPQARLTWRQDPQYSGVNVLTMGIYHEVIQRWFSSEMTVSSVSSATWVPERVHWESGERVPVKIPDAVHILGRMGDNALLNYRFSGMEPGAGRNEIRLIGNRAALRVAVGEGRLTIAEGSGPEVEVPVPEASRRGWQVEADFISSIREGTPVRLTSFDEGLRYMAFTQAVAEGIRGE